MSHRFLALLFLLSLSLPVCAHQVAPVEVTLTQSDGTSFEAPAKGSIDGRWLETAGGYTVVERKGTWFYAQEAGDGSLEPSHLKVEPRRFAEKSYQDELSFFPKHLSPQVIPFEEEASHPVKIG